MAGVLDQSLDFAIICTLIEAELYHADVSHAHVLNEVTSGIFLVKRFQKYFYFKQGEKIKLLRQIIEWFFVEISGAKL